MRTQATISGSELLLGVIAIRLAVLVLVGWSLTLLPQQASNGELACTPSFAREVQQPPKTGSNLHVADPAFADMLRHD